MAETLCTSLMGRTHCTRLRDPLSGQPGTIHPMTTIRDWRSPGRILSPVADGGSTEIIKEIIGRGLGL